jgi:endogenous inhibitor of DNA gyrase (YacG/DUF329 family)
MNTTEINCPQCGQLTFYGPQNPDRPFCSARCKLIDLGQWANETYRVPSQTEPNQFDLNIDQTDVHIESEES